jgi:flagellar hook assembly protein FlgD
LNKAANVEFELIDEVGKVIGIVGSDFYGAGTHTLNWNSRTGFGSELSSGAYSIRMNADGNTDFIKVMIVK